MRKWQGIRWTTEKFSIRKAHSNLRLRWPTTVTKAHCVHCVITKGVPCRWLNSRMKMYNLIIWWANKIHKKSSNTAMGCVIKDNLKLHFFSQTKRRIIENHFQKTLGDKPTLEYVETRKWYRSNIQGNQGYMDSSFHFLGILCLQCYSKPRICII